MRIFTLVMLSMISQYAIGADLYTAGSGETYPWCGENASDDDNDGWGWENEASCKVPAKTYKNADGEVIGVSQLPVDEMGRRYYGTGPFAGNYTWKKSGRVRIYCKGDFFHDDDDDWGEACTAYVGKTGGFVKYLKYSADAGSCDCAKAKAIVGCVTENSLDYCEANVAVW